MVTPTLITRADGMAVEAWRAARRIGSSRQDQAGCNGQEGGRVHDALRTHGTITSLFHVLHVSFVSYMRIFIRDLMNLEEALFGVPAGRVCLSKLIEGTQEADTAEICFLDFSRIAAATVSFLREGPLAFRELLGTRSSNLYPVFTNLAPVISDSLRDYLEMIGDAVFACDLGEGEAPENVQLIGRLESKQRLTFEAVRRRSEATATQLAEECGEAEEVGVTAWNNRLAVLVRKRLLIEVRSGRSKKFRLALEQEA